MATETQMPSDTTIQSRFNAAPEVNISAPSSKPTWDVSNVLTTLYEWPQMEPLRYAEYSPKHLHLPLRRDLLHRAVVYEGDATRQGTASTKWRDDVRGSGRKLLPQKGTGHARVGDKKSPIRKGGGVAFGPHPRDFSTGLPRKVYDLAWRTALSYRYRRGELIVVDNKIHLEKDASEWKLVNIFENQQWGQGHGRALLITKVVREKLFNAMAEIGEHGVAKDMYDVDVKDLLETRRVIIEKQALDTLLAAHESDLGSKLSLPLAQRKIEAALATV